MSYDINFVFCVIIPIAVFSGFGIEGACLVSSNSLKDITDRLKMLFPVMEADTGDSSFDIYNIVEANVFQSYGGEGTRK
jgi:hypothetical protein